MKNIYIKPRFYITIACITLLFIGGVFIEIFYPICIVFLVIICLLFFVDLWILKRLSSKISGKRIVQEKLSLGDLQFIEYSTLNDSSIKLDIELIDELPFQFQHRENIFNKRFLPSESKTLYFEIFPKERGVYQFGQLYGFLSNTLIGFIQLKIIIAKPTESYVYPSIIQMKKFELHVLHKSAHLFGMRKIRTIGENDEFEQIRNYQIGDNEKSINWKATSRKNELLVNQFQDSRSQNVYCIIDKGRSMEMPFESLTLLDYAINSTLVISNISLQKYDKAGLITFCDKMDSMLTASSSPRQLENILKILYAQESVFKESNFELLYLYIRKKISKRSIVFLYTNFESKADLARNISYIKMLSKQHLLVVIIFINTELSKKSEILATQLSEIYEQTLAQSLLNEKEAIAIELNQYGIQTILTKPEDLSIKVINKYLEIKAKRSK